MARNIGTTIASATRCPLLEEQAKLAFDNGEVADWEVDFWFHGCRTTEEDYSFFLMSEYWELIVKDEPLKVMDTIIPLADLIAVRESKTSEWDYDNEYANTRKPTQCFHQLHDSMRLNVMSMFTACGFDHAIYQEKHILSFCPHIQPAINNRFIDLGEVYAGEEDSMWYHMTHKGLDGDKQTGNSLTISEAYSLILSYRVRDLAVTHRNEIRAKLAKCDDMWSHAGSAFKKYTNVSILGDPVAVPVSYAEARRIFTDLTDKEFEDVYKFEDTSSVKASELDLSDDAKAVLCIKCVLDLLGDPTSNFNLSSHNGIARFLARLSNMAFDKAEMVKIHTMVEQLYNEGRKLEAYTLFNMIAPCNPFEAHLRCQILVNRLLFVLGAMEGQKRKVGNIYNRLDLIPSYESIPSFFDIPKGRQFGKRIPLETLEIPRGVHANMIWKKQEAAHFERSSVNIETHLLGLSAKYPGLTQEFALRLKKESEAYARANKNIQQKSVNDYISNMCVVLSQQQRLLYHMFIDFPQDLKVPDWDDKGERDLKAQITRMRRLFVEKMFDYCDSEELKTEIGNDFVSSVTTSLGNGLDSFLSKLTSKNQAAETAGSEFATNFATYVSTCNSVGYTMQEHTHDIYRFPNYLNIPTLTRQGLDFSKEGGRLLDPSKIEFWYSLYILNCKQGAAVGTFGHSIPDGLRPLELQLLSILFSHCVYSDKSMESFANFFFNNGSKCFKYSSACNYVFDVNESKEYYNMVRPQVSCVWI